jgi:hypothetical protein
MRVRPTQALDAAFVGHQRTLGRRYYGEEGVLRDLRRFVVAQQAADLNRRVQTGRHAWGRCRGGQRYETSDPAISRIPLRSGTTTSERKRLPCPGEESNSCSFPKAVKGLGKSGEDLPPNLPASGYLLRRLGFLGRPE